MSNEPVLDAAPGSAQRYPILYSFRRCPYAMRARLSLATSGTVCVLREVVLARKPTALLLASPKGTVPILVLPDGQVLGQFAQLGEVLAKAHARDASLQFAERATVGVSWLEIEGVHLRRTTGHPQNDQSALAVTRLNFGS